MSTKALSRVQQVVGIMMLGDGLLAAMRPKGHVGLWRMAGAPKFWNRTVLEMRNRPGLVRGLGIAAAATGAYLGWRANKSH
jgi:hypothetical protein